MLGSISDILCLIELHPFAAGLGMVLFALFFGAVETFHHFFNDL